MKTLEKEGFLETFDGMETHEMAARSYVERIFPYGFRIICSVTQINSQCEETNQKRKSNIIVLKLFIEIYFYICISYSRISIYRTLIFSISIMYIY